MITKEQFSTIEALFNYYNQELFSGILNDCMLNMSRKNGAMGFFSPNRWKGKNGKLIHEISINPDTFSIDDTELHQTIVHEMCHHWQYDFGKPSRQCYHNKEWALQMIKVGLMPSDTGKVGGKITGQHMSDYIITGGLLDLKLKQILNGTNNIKLPYYPIKFSNFTLNISNEGDNENTDNISKNGKKFKYTCDCGINIWGKFEIEVQCLNCNSKFQMEIKM